MHRGSGTKRTTEWPSKRNASTIELRVIRRILMSKGKVDGIWNEDHRTTTVSVGLIPSDSLFLYQGIS